MQLLVIIWEFQGHPLHWFELFFMLSKAFSLELAAINTKTAYEKFLLKFQLASTVRHKYLISKVLSECNRFGFCFVFMFRLRDEVIISLSILTTETMKSLFSTQSSKIELFQNMVKSFKRLRFNWKFPNLI